MPRLSSPRRVAVTGVGLVSPLGVGNRENWDALTAGRSGLAPITRFDASRFACRIAGEVKGFDPSLYIDKKEIKKMATNPLRVAAASRWARVSRPTRIASTSRWSWVRHRRLADRGDQRNTSRAAAIPSHLALLHHRPHRERGRRGISSSTGSRAPTSPRSPPATGAHAVGEAYRMIQYGDADPRSPAAPSVITPLAVGVRLMRPSTRNDDPRAFASLGPGRDGFVIAEGGLVVLEEMDSASAARGSTRARGLRHVGRRGYRRALRGRRRPHTGHEELSLRRGDGRGLDYINARHLHAARRQGRDDAIKRVFGSTRRNSRSPRQKSMTGHAGGAAGGSSRRGSARWRCTRACCRRRSTIKSDPSAIWTTCPTRRAGPRPRCAVNSFGFGGTNWCLILKGLILREVLRP